MAFQKIKQVETPEFYLELAFRRARTSVPKKLTKDKARKKRHSDRHKIDLVKETLYSKLEDIGKTFPEFEDLGNFYQELMRATLDVDKFRKSLGAVAWARKKTANLGKKFLSLLKMDHYPQNIVNQYYGRASSVVKQISDELKYLEKCRKIMRQYPVIKKMNTVAIAGFPNVGKSTLLGKLSSSKPEVAGYAFTTKGIMIGYIDKKIQLLDTPGTLNRVDKMNSVEKQAYLAMKLLADKIIYVFDLTEPFPLKDQIKLFENIKKFKKPVIIYLSKTDILDKKIVDGFKKKYKTADIEELKKL